MKKFFISFSVLLCVICLLCVNFAGSSVSAETESANRIIVNGYGQVAVEPNLAIVNLGVESFDEELSKAEEINTDKVSSVISKLQGFGINETEIKTNHFIGHKYQNIDNEVSASYYAYDNIEFKTKDLENVENLVSDIQSSDEVCSYQVNYTIDNYEDAYALALSDAFDNAKNKASTITGKEFSRYEICENHQFNKFCFNLKNAFNDNKDGIVVRAKVRVIFEY